MNLTFWRPLCLKKKIESQESRVTRSEQRKLNIMGDYGKKKNLIRCKSFYYICSWCMNRAVVKYFFRKWLDIDATNLLFFISFIWLKPHILKFFMSFFVFAAHQVKSTSKAAMNAGVPNSHPNWWLSRKVTCSNESLNCSTSLQEFLGILIKEAHTWGKHSALWVPTRNEANTM